LLALAYILSLLAPILSLSLSFSLSLSLSFSPSLCFYGFSNKEASRSKKRRRLLKEMGEISKISGSGWLTSFYTSEFFWPTNLNPSLPVEGRAKNG
jgi:hypothetical protein